MAHAPDTVIVRGRGLPPAQRSDAPAGLPTEVMGEPVHYFWKPLVKAQTYHHPDKRYGDKKDGRITFTRQDLADADRYTKEWLKDGGKPFVPTGHKGVNANLGWIVDTKFDGDTLWGLHQFIGDDAKRVAARHETSVCLSRKFTDGTTGKTFPILVEHNAVVANPVASGLGGFVQLSRTAGGPTVEVPIFEAAFPKGNPVCRLPPSWSRRPATSWPAPPCPTT